MSLQNNPNFTEIFVDTRFGKKYYMPVQITEYHKSRELAMAAQERFAQCGISKEFLQIMAEKMIDAVNNVDNKSTLRTDVAVIANNILARLKEPVDEHCAVRMGAIAAIWEDEDPNKVDYPIIERKMQMAKENPDLYAFFLNTGVAFLPEYVQVLRTLTAEEYFLSRKIMLNGLTPTQHTP